MKNYLSTFVLVLLLAGHITGFSQVKIGVNPSSTDSSAMLEVESTAKGFLPPRMNTAQRDSIQNPAIGLVIFNTETKDLQWYVGGNIWHEASGENLYREYPVGTYFCNGLVTEIIDVTNPTTGEIWMDRNLGASQVATGYTDANAYGDLYQWGRFADGHQCRNSDTTSTLSSSDQPVHGNFILAPNSPSDWRSPQNTNLWQGVNGVNNPCPSGYRLPTEAELNAERNSWSSNNTAGAFASPLKLPLTGSRVHTNGYLFAVAVYGNYWSSTVSGFNSRGLSFYDSNAYMRNYYRAYGNSVRCIKD